MAEIAKVKAGSEINNTTDIYNEYACGIIFDISKRNSPFEDYRVALNYFGDGQVQEIGATTNLKEYGIEKDGILSGIPFYHLNLYQQILKHSASKQPIYVMFADLTDMSGIDKMLAKSAFRIFQIGIWTEKNLNSELIQKYKSTLLSFTTKTVFNGIKYTTPISVILSANYAQYNSFKELPNLLNDDIPGLSVILSQAATAEVHAIQSKTINHTPVGCIGAILGVLANCPAETSIADNSKFGLGQFIPEIELGIGNNGTPIDYEKDSENLIDYYRNIIASKGYIFLIDKDGDPGESYFCNDQTLSTKDYNTISRCRITNKVYRITRRVLTNYINSTVHLGNLKSTDITLIQNAIYSGVRKYMGESSNASGYSQIQQINADIDYNESILKSRQLKIDITITPADSSKDIIMSETINTNK